MSSNNYEYALQQLCTSLDLEAPRTFDSVVSLQVGNHVCNITEHPADQLLMFIELQPLDDAPVGEQNLFCQDLCKPILGVDPLSHSKILWNRQSLGQMDRAMVHHQLEQLVQAAEELTGGEAA
ncbi:CesT family type III secretion system chaperone [Pseudomonas sp. MWU13-3659]|uniref:CesT family type III secretion system chaperone n=1 Tax=Pseudomonas sp. MWU13-3659 TaxID=2986964 RepID=UPI002074ECD6|nr:CesT family type III secretion system chaperone [Pseudomonas sp. MWU13-3659]